MKIYLNFSKLIKSSSIILILLLLTSCSPQEYNDMKKINARTNEYNEIIELYNKMSVDFTSFARFVNKELKKEEKDSIYKVAEKYNNKSEDLFEKIEKVKEKEFRYNEIVVVREEIKPMILDMYKYLDSIKDIEQIDRKQIQDFNDQMNQLYEGILNQSISVTEKFQEIYEEHILQKKD